MIFKSIGIIIWVPMVLNELPTYWDKIETLSLPKKIYIFISGYSTIVNGTSKPFNWPSPKKKNRSWLEFYYAVWPRNRPQMNLFLIIFFTYYTVIHGNRESCSIPNGKPSAKKGVSLKSEGILTVSMPNSSKGVSLKSEGILTVSMPNSSKVVNIHLIAILLEVHSRAKAPLRI